MALAVNVTDNVSTGLTPALSCTGNGTLTGSMLATTVVTADTTVICTARATDAAGNVGTGSVTIQVKATVATLTVGEGQTNLLQGQAGLLVASSLPLTESSYQGMLNGKAITLYRASTTGLSFLVPTDLAAGAYTLSVVVGTRTYTFSVTVAATAAIADPKSVVSQALTQARGNIDDFLTTNGASMTSTQRAQYTAYRQTIVDALAQINTFSQADLAKLATQLTANALYQAGTTAATGISAYNNRQSSVGTPTPFGVYSIEVCNTSANLFVLKNVKTVALIGIAAALFTLPEPSSKILASIALGVAIGNLALPGGVLSEITKVALSCYNERSYTTLYETNVQQQNNRIQFVRSTAAVNGTGFRNRQPTSLRIQQILQLDSNVAGKVNAGLAQLNQILSSLPYIPESVSSVLSGIVPEKTQFVPSAEVSLAGISPSRITGTKGGSGEVVTLTFSAEPAEQDIDFTFTLDRVNGTTIPLLGTLIIAVPGADDAAFEVMQGKATQTTVPIRGADSVEIVTQPTHGIATLTKDGLLNYTPSGQYFGSDVLTFRARNANGLSRTATVSISVVRNFAGQWQVTTRSTTTSQSSANLCPNETNTFSITVSKVTDTQYTTSYQGFPITLTMSNPNDPAGLSGSTTVTYPDDPGSTTETVNARIPDSTSITGNGTFSYTGPNNSRCSGTTSITGVR